MTCSVQENLTNPRSIMKTLYVNIFLTPECIYFPITVPRWFLKEEIMQKKRMTFEDQMGFFFFFLISVVVYGAKGERKIIIVLQVDSLKVQLLLITENY